MIFESGGIYHIYNQGNNRQVIFYNRNNYLFFLQKIRSYIQPYGNILAWCLMPNHFHLMVEVEVAVIDYSKGVTPVVPVDPSIISRGATPGCAPSDNSEGFTSSETLTKNPRIITLNNSIGVLLRSYTRAINHQEKRTGSLFRKETKSICLNEIKGISSNWFTSFGVTFMNVQIPEYQYTQVCFNYIHNNPVKSGLIENPEDWEFSSYQDLKGIRKGTLVNRKRFVELGLSI